MITIKPVLSYNVTCPKCKAEDQRCREIIFMGKFTLGQSNCESCDTLFYHTLPVGHAQLLPVAFTANKQFVVYNKEASWWAKPLLKAFFKDKKASYSIEKIHYQHYDEVVLLICLDSCYGHSLTNLLNAQALLKNEGVGVVVVIQKAFQWMLPEGIVKQ